MPGHRRATGYFGSLPRPPEPERLGNGEDDIRVADTAANTVHDEAGSCVGHAFGSDAEMTCLINNRPKAHSPE